MYDIGIVIGRFQPLHLGHVSLIRKASNVSNKVIIINGHSGFQDIRNPFPHADIANLLSTEFTDDNIKVVKFLDNCSNDLWNNKLRNKIIPPNEPINKLKICLIGGRKDLDWYNEFFPTWDYLINTQYSSINATLIRKYYFLEGKIMENLLPNNTIKYLTEFKNTENYKYIAQGYMSYYQKGIY